MATAGGGVGAPRALMLGDIRKGISRWIAVGGEILGLSETTSLCHYGRWYNAGGDSSIEQVIRVQGGPVDPVKLECWEKKKFRGRGFEVMRWLSRYLGTY